MVSNTGNYSAYQVITGIIGACRCDDIKQIFVPEHVRTCSNFLYSTATKAEIVRVHITLLVQNKWKEFWAALVNMVYHK